MCTTWFLNSSLAVVNQAQSTKPQLFGPGSLGHYAEEKGTLTRVILEAEEANAISRRPYARTIRPKRRAMSTSMAHYQRGGAHCRGRASERGLALT